MNKEYLAPLWNDTVGIIALICAAIMVIAGSLVIKRIIEIEV
jgi:Flp pilus assembly protein TadB